MLMLEVNLSYLPGGFASIATCRTDLKGDFVVSSRLQTVCVQLPEFIQHLSQLPVSLSTVGGGKAKTTDESRVVEAGKINKTNTCQELISVKKNEREDPASPCVGEKIYINKHNI